MKNTIEETTRLLLQGTLTKEEADKILLDLHIVTHRRELLKAFMKHIEKGGAVTFRDYDWTIQLFEEDNKSLL